MQESVIVKLSLGAHLRRQQCHSVTVDKNRSYCFNIFALLKIHQHQNHLFYWGLCHLHHGVHSLSHWMSHQMDQICPLKQRIKFGKIFSLKSRAWFKFLSNWGALNELTCWFGGGFVLVRWCGKWYWRTTKQQVLGFAASTCHNHINIRHSGYNGTMVNKMIFKKTVNSKSSV